MSTNAFTKLGNTVAFLANTAAPTAVQCVSTTLGGNQYRIINDSTYTVFLGVGTTAALATANAVAPVAGNPSPAIVLVPGAVEILRFARTSYFSGLASAAATVYIVQGEGI